MGRRSVRWQRSRAMPPPVPRLVVSTKSPRPTWRKATNAAQTAPRPQTTSTAKRSLFAGTGIMEGDEKCDSGCTSASFEECKDCEESGDCANLCPTECPALQQISGTGCQTECVIGLGSSTL